MNWAVFLLLFIILVVLVLIIGPRMEPRKKRGKNHLPMEEFNGITFSLFPEDKRTFPADFEFTLKCPKCGKNLVLDQFAEDGFSQNPDGGWWVCPDGHR